MWKQVDFRLYISEFVIPVLKTDSENCELFERLFV